MRLILVLLFAAGCVLADDEETRSSKSKSKAKPPFVVDALGKPLPPPSNVPATVGSPVNLLTPDRYEFYTFDESGELVKRLMTLEEIQAIVAAGEETEGLVTFANDNQPTIAFNFSQPPYTKVHSVVTNVQNVLKAQMEAHKNKPLIQPTLDTPDVSDSWSLILPSIFGNSGADIVPDKSSGPFTTPETETIELEQPVEVDESSFSKEGNNQELTTVLPEKLKDTPHTERVSLITEEVKTTPSTTTTVSTSTSTTTTTRKPTTTTTTTTRKPTTTTTTTRKPTTTTTTTRRPTTTTTTTRKPTTTTTTTTTTPKPSTTTTRKPTTTTSKPTTVKPRTTTTAQPRTTITSTTARKPTTTTSKPTTTPKVVEKTTQKSTTAELLTTQKEIVSTKIVTQANSNVISTTDKNEIQYEKISTFIPISTAAYVAERTTKKPAPTTKPPKLIVSTTKKIVTSTTQLPYTTKHQPITTTYAPISFTTEENVASTTKGQEMEKINVTTITTQSVSPSTTVSSTEFVSAESAHLNEDKPVENEEKEDEMLPMPMLPLFDVAQSISQIASDLGGNYQPIPTTSNLLDVTKVNAMDMESKENLEIDIPSDIESGTDTETKPIKDADKNVDNFVKISTFDPHSSALKHEDKPSKDSVDANKNKLGTEVTTEKSEITTNEPVSPTTTIDPILSGSMEDLLSQVVNQAPQSILGDDNVPNDETKISTTEKGIDATTVDSSPIIETTPQPATKIEKDSPSKLEEKPSEVFNKKHQAADQLILDASEKEKKPSKPLHHQKVEVSSQAKPNKIKNTTEEFVPIPTLINKDDSKIISSSTSAPKPEGNVNKIKDEISQNATPTEAEKLVADTEKSNIEIVTESSPKAEITTTSTKTVETTENVLAHTTTKKISVSNVKVNEKIPEIVPVVNDFKKKIQKLNIDEKELANERNNSWKLISTVSPPKGNEIPKDKLKDGHHADGTDKNINLEFSKENQGLEVTTKDLGEDIAQFTELCNELAFRYWNTMVENIDKKRSFVLSPYSITSMLAMMFMGARGATSGEMNEILKLDDMVTFNPHFTLKNISDSIETTPESGVIVSAFIRELYSDRNKGKILTFYKERAQHFYNGHVEEINFKLISDIIRRRTNLLVKRYTWGRIAEYMKTNSITMQPPLAAFSMNIFQTDCTGSSVEGRDGEMYFVVSPNVRQRRLVPVPAVVYRTGFLAGYDPVLDATAAAIGTTNSVISTLFVMPGQQGNVVHAEDLEALEQRLLDANPSTPAWNRLLRTLLPRIGLELQIPRFSHKSIFNVSSTLKKMGLKDLFDSEHADLGGLNGPSKDLYLSDMIQSTWFVTCGEGVISEQHHIEDYPERIAAPQKRRTSRWTMDWDEPRDYQRAFHDPHDVGDAMHLPLHLRPRQARLPSRSAQPARLKFDRPFLYFVRHNPSGMILYVGRYNPRLLP